jgi:hypothetical protein
MTAIDRESLIYDWNTTGKRPAPPTGIQFDDETLRDGLQSPSAIDPSLETKIELIHLMEKLGIQTADVGLPGAGARAREHITRLVREMAPLKIKANVACRTLVGDIAPIVDVVQATGQPVEVCAFIGSSPRSASWALPKRRGTSTGARSRSATRSARQARGWSAPSPTSCAAARRSTRWRRSASAPAWESRRSSSGSTARPAVRDGAKSAPVGARLAESAPVVRPDGAC